MSGATRQQFLSFIRWALGPTDTFMMAAYAITAVAIIYFNFVGLSVMTGTFSGILFGLILGRMSAIDSEG